MDYLSYGCTFYFFFDLAGFHRDLHVLTHSFPTRRSSDLLKGVSQTTYLVRWDPDILPESLPDCGVEIPASGLFEGFSLSKREDGSYQLTGRWQPARSEEHTSELQ